MGNKRGEEKQVWCGAPTRVSPLKNFEKKEIHERMKAGKGKSESAANGGKEVLEGEPGKRRREQFMSL